MEEVALAEADMADQEEEGLVDGAEGMEEEGRVDGVEGLEEEGRVVGVTGLEDLEDRVDGVLVPEDLADRGVRDLAGVSGADLVASLVGSEMAYVT